MTTSCALVWVGQRRSIGKLAHVRGGQFGAQMFRGRRNDEVRERNPWTMPIPAATELASATRDPLVNAGPTQGVDGPDFLAEESRVAHVRYQVRRT